MTIQSHYNLYWFKAVYSSAWNTALFASFYMVINMARCFNLQEAMDILYDSENNVQIDDGDNTGT